MAALAAAACTLAFALWWSSGATDAPGRNDAQSLPRPRAEAGAAPLPQPPPPTTANGRISPEQLVRMRLVDAKGQPVAGCAITIAPHERQPLRTTSDESGCVVDRRPQSISRVTVTPEWGATWTPHPFERVERPDDDAADWNLGDITLPAVCSLTVTLDTDPTVLSMVQRKQAIVRLQVALGLFPGSLLMQRARREGRLLWFDFHPEDFTDGLGKKTFWIPYDGDIELMGSLCMRTTKGPSVFGKYRSEIVAPGRYRDVVVQLHEPALIGGVVVWSDGKPAAGIGIEAWGDGCSYVSNDSTDSLGRFSLFSLNAATGILKGKVGTVTFSQPYARTTNNQVTLPVATSYMFMVRVVDGGKPVEHSGVFRLNSIERDEAGRLLQDREFLRRRTETAPGGIHYLDVRRLSAGERLYVVTEAHGETAWITQRSLEQGQTMDIEAAGNCSHHDATIELPRLEIGELSMLHLKEASQRGDPGSSVWLRGRQAFLAGTIEIQHLYPGTYHVDVLGEPSIKLPDLVVPQK